MCGVGHDLHMRPQGNQNREEHEHDLRTANSGRRDFLKTVVLGTAAAGAATTFFGDVERASLSVPRAAAANLKMAFIQWQPHTVPAAWSKGIEEVPKPQQDDRIRTARRARRVAKHLPRLAKCRTLWEYKFPSELSFPARRKSTALRSTTGS